MDPPARGIYGLLAIRAARRKGLCGAQIAHWCDTVPALNSAVASSELVNKEVRPADKLVQAPQVSKVILLAEDEDIVRMLARRVLEKSGYVVYEARNGREGLALCEAHEGRIDMLVSDVVMPELGGRELAEGALKLRPGIKIMFMSGHTQDVVLNVGVLNGTPFLQKPFTPFGLAHKVRQTLDSDFTAAAAR